MWNTNAWCQHSVARKWNEALLSAIRVDYARPVVHARNLFHVSAAMYDAWAAYDSVARPFLLGQTVRGFNCPFDGVSLPADIKSAREEAISYAAYRLLKHRFAHSPGAAVTLPLMDSLLQVLGYDSSYLATDYRHGPPAALGNYIADCYIRFGLQDGSNEGGTPPYSNQYYKPVNLPMLPDVDGDPTVRDPNRWQALNLGVFIDQSGHPVVFGKPVPFLGAEWGNVVPFALDSSDLTVYHRNGDTYCVYHDPGPPPYLDTTGNLCLDDNYKWSFLMVAIWSAQLDTADGVMIDISPGSFGNTPFDSLPKLFAGYRAFYNYFSGGAHSKGRRINPYTGKPYAPNIVHRGDYTRVLAEFWADGPQSETPPGHWFVILNYVDDHPLFQRRFQGKGPVMDALEWDVKAYLTLGGAVQDAAISAWSTKGWYDYIRPISAIRMMADFGQCSDPKQPHYNPKGIPLIPGYVGLIDSSDALALREDFVIGDAYAHVGEIKIRAWRGDLVHFIDPKTQEVGVGWMRAANWWPYQRQTFVTPPFAGYPSGHSAYSRAAAEVMTLLTGSEYFPGGIGEFYAPKNEFLKFENGPSEDITLQWATYRDASDQTSLSRIWGGIHPPADDMPGRLIGKVVGVDAFQHALAMFEGR